MDITRKTLPEQHYIYVEREASFKEGNAIADAMASGFGEIFGFTQANNITPLTMPSSIYIEMPSGDTMKFRTGVFVSAKDAGRVSGDIKSDCIPAGDALTATHVGPYTNMNQSHKALWDYADAQGLTKGMPVWEIYIDDPTTKPEAEVRTEIFRGLSE